MAVGAPQPPEQVREALMPVRVGAPGDGLRLLENIGVRLTVEVGRAEMTIRDLLRLSEGSVIELDRLAGDPLDVLVNGTLIANSLSGAGGTVSGLEFHVRDFGSGPMA